MHRHWMTSLIPLCALQAKLLGTKPTAQDRVLTWAGPLAGSRYTALVVNNDAAPQQLKLFASSVLTAVDAGKYIARDLWRHKDLPGTYGHGDTLTFPAVGGHDCIMLTFRKG